MNVRTVKLDDQRQPRGAFPRGYDVAAARRALVRCDPRLARWMRQIGGIDTAWHQRFDPVNALAQSILYQQLSGKAAATITGRVREAWCEGGRMTSENLLAAPESGLRACGVSFNKIAALKDLAEKSQRGVVPTVAKMRWLDDDEIVERISSVRGIGRWTVEMMLIFHLGRPNVLPIDDLGVQRGVQIVLGLPELPKARALPQLCADWAPWWSMASLYLWRVADLQKLSK